MHLTECTSTVVAQRVVLKYTTTLSAETKCRIMWPVLLLCIVNTCTCNYSLWYQLTLYYIIFTLHSSTLSAAVCNIFWRYCMFHLDSAYSLPQSLYQNSDRTSQDIHIIRCQGGLWPGQAANHFVHLKPRAVCFWAPTQFGAGETAAVGENTPGQKCKYSYMTGNTGVLTNSLVSNMPFEEILCIVVMGIRELKLQIVVTS